MKLMILVAAGIYGIYLLRRLLSTKELLPFWDKILSKVWIGYAVAIGLRFYEPLNFVLSWYNKAAYVLIFFALYQLRNYRPRLFDSSKTVSTDRVYALRNYYPARPFLIALLPLFAVYAFSIVCRVLYPMFINDNNHYFENPFWLSISWMLGFGLYAVVQVKKEKKLWQIMKEEALIAEARKAELEELVTERTNQLQVQNEKLKQALAELTITQKQLIQAEKMASLGELTAGIAHEIQNPLNFVNNFSEVNIEMLEELKAEQLKDNDQRSAKLELEIINDIINNESKINFHGRRADAIVKSMLQHSQKNKGQKVPTDINALCDEYLRLSYHGLRAKDKSFNCEIITEFDDALGLVNVVPQDMGRVILNLVNNAFYAVQAIPAAEPVTRKPMVTVTTKRKNGNIVIGVKDNGTGIPDKIKDKIFQPFFTTKPTGQGTGLGLSLSYDIVKAHDGEIEVESKPGEYTLFIVMLPTQA